MIRVVLFDIDGTLIRTGGAGVEAFKKTFESEFNAPQATQGIQFAGRTDSSLVRECFKNHTIEPSPENFRRFYDVYVFRLHNLLTHTSGGACPGVRELIGDLQKRADPPLIGLLTGNIRLGAEIKLRHYDLWGLFEVGAFGDDHEDRDHLAGIALKRASKALDLSISGDEILVVGDTPRDIQCANSVRAKSLAVSTGSFPEDQLAPHKPTLLAEDLMKVTADEICNL